MQTVLDLLIVWIVCCMFLSLSVSLLKFLVSFSSISNQIKPRTEEFEIWEWSQNPLFLNPLRMALGFNFVSFKICPGRLHTHWCQSVFCLLPSFCQGSRLASGVPWLVWRAQGGMCIGFSCPWELVEGTRKIRPSTYIMNQDFQKVPVVSSVQPVVSKRNSWKPSLRQKKAHPDLVEQRASNQRNTATLETSS